MKIEKRGFLKGSCGWLAEQLKDAKLVIEQNYIFVEFIDGKSKVIAGVNDDKSYYHECARTTHDEKYWYAYPDNSEKFAHEYEYLFKTHLTDAARHNVNDFIKDALDKFINAWEGDTDK